MSLSLKLLASTLLVLGLSIAAFAGDRTAPPKKAPTPPAATTIETGAAPSTGTARPHHGRRHHAPGGHGHRHHGRHHRGHKK